MRIALSIGRMAVLAIAMAGHTAATQAQEQAFLPDPGAPEGAVATAHIDRPFASYALPVGPHTPGAADVREVEGRVVWSGFRLDSPGTSTAEVMEGYRTRLAALGFEPVFDCANATCGGFDFRFAVQLLPPPAMLIDSADFAQFSASRDDGGETAAYVSVLVSRLLGAVHIQTVTVSPGESGLTIAPAPEPGAAARQVILEQDEAMLLDRLTEFGHVPVQGLIFETGGAALSEGSAPALKALARFLNSNPELAVLIVGHSDNQGSLDTNIALSKLRADAVRTALIDRGVAAGRLEAHGAGFLAPITANTTEAGRARNRRVELVLR